MLHLPGRGSVNEDHRADHHESCKHHYGVRSRCEQMKAMHLDS